jgi:hypothetical protein
MTRALLNAVYRPKRRMLKMMTDKKFDKLMKDAKDILNKMPEAHNFSHRTVYNPAALTTSWYLEDSKMEELMGPNVGAWGNPNPVEKFVTGCEHTINALMGALKEMASDYDSLARQFNEYRDRQPSEKAKELFDHVNCRGVQQIDILVDNDKAHLKVENQKMPAVPVTTLEDEYVEKTATVAELEAYGVCEKDGGGTV